MKNQKWINSTWSGVFAMATAVLSASSANAFVDCDCEYDTAFPTNDWVKKLQFNGDFQFRYDYADSDAVAYRHSLRMRARLAVRAELCEWASLNFRLATDGGEVADTHQVLSGCFSMKNFNLDRAYASVHSPDWDQVQLHFGKVENFAFAPHFLSPMVWDKDVNPEGIVLTGEFDWDEDFHFFGTAAYYVIDEMANSNPDPDMFDLMFGADWMNDWVDATVAVGYLHTMELTTKPVQFTNRVNVSNYVGNYHVLTLYGSISHTLSEDDFFGTSTKLCLDGAYVNNLNDRFDLLGNHTGWSIQGSFGEITGPGSWMLAVQYKDLERDASLDFIADNEFGRTGRRGWIFAGKYMVCEWWTMAARFYLTDQIGSSDDLFRAQVETTMMF